MSKLILKGDLAENFGKYLPAPYIEYVYVYDTYLEIQLSLLFAVADDQDVDAYVNYLRDTGLKFFIVGVPTADSIEEVINKDITIQSLAYMTTKTTDAERRYETVATFEWGDVPSTYTTVYTDDGQKVVKFALNSLVQWPPENATSPLEEHFAEKLFWTSGKYLTIFAFSTLVDVLDVNFNVNRFDKDAITGTDPSRSDFYHLMTSNLSYENIFENGALASKVETAYMDLNGAAYNKIPIQTLDGIYRQTDDVSLKDIVGDFQKLIDTTEATGTTDAETQRVVSNLSYVLSAYGENEGLLRELNKLRQTFPDKLPTSAVGRLYRLFRRKLYTYNRMMSAKSQVSKQLTRNPKVIDMRGSDASYTPPTQVTDGAVGDDEHDADPENNTSTDYLYTQTKVVSAQNYVVNTNSSPGADEPTYVTTEVMQYTGWWWFDYEKYLRKASNLSAMVDVYRLEQLFDFKIPYEYLGIGNATMTRENSGVTTTIRTNLNFRSDFLSSDNKGYEYEDFEWDTSAYHRDFPYSTGVQYDNTDNTSETYGYPTKTNGSSTLQSTLLLRNFDTTEDSETGQSYLGGYRLMGFYFADTMPGDLEWTSGQWDVNIQIWDKTHHIMKLLMSQYYVMRTQFDVYADLASEFCNYNSTDGTFNTFFKEAMEAQFGTDPNNHPWNAMVGLYYLHQELILNVFEGNMDKLREQVKTTIESINPETGTYTNLSAFKEQVDSFYDTYYSATEVVTTGE